VARVGAGDGVATGRRLNERAARVGAQGDHAGLAVAVVDGDRAGRGAGARRHWGDRGADGDRLTRDVDREVGRGRGGRVGLVDRDAGRVGRAVEVAVARVGAGDGVATGRRLNERAARVGAQGDHAGLAVAVVDGDRAGRGAGARRHWGDRGADGDRLTRDVDREVGRGRG